MKYTIPLHIFFHYTRIWKKIFVGGLYTSLFCAIIPALFPYFLPFWYPYILLHFQMFFITLSLLRELNLTSSDDGDDDNSAKSTQPTPYLTSRIHIAIHDNQFACL